MHKDRKGTVTKLRGIADYQFGEGAGSVLFPEDVDFKRTTTGRVRQIHLDGHHVATLKNDGRLSLGDGGARLLHGAFEPPSLRVEFGDESLPYLRDGRNGFAKFVRRVDEGIRSRDEVVVTGPEDEFVGAGRAELSADEMRDFETGVAVMTR